MESQSPDTFVIMLVVIFIISGLRQVWIDGLPEDKKPPKTWIDR